jgi:hypothetical protein
MSSVVNDQKDMDGPLPAPLAQLKELAQIGSVVMRMNNTQKMTLLAVVVQVVMSFIALSVSAKVPSVVKGRILTIFGSLFMVFAGMSAFYGMVTIPKVGLPSSGQKIAMGAMALMTFGIIMFSIGYSKMKKDLDGDDSELTGALTSGIITILLSVAVFVGIGMKYHPVNSANSFGSYRYF